VIPPLPRASGRGERWRGRWAGRPCYALGAHDAAPAGDPRCDAAPSSPFLSPPWPSPAPPRARGLAEQVPTIAQLLQEGWEVVGYTGSGTTFILLRHKDRDHLVQCTVLYDTTRGPSMAERVRSNCYEVR